MLKIMLKIIGTYCTDLKPHNMVLSNYEGKIGHTLGAIQIDLTINSITRPTMFMVITLRYNQNLLMGSEWIYDIGAIPSSLHQRISIWRQVSFIENVKDDIVITLRKSTT